VPPAVKNDLDNVSPAPMVATVRLIVIGPAMSSRPRGDDAELLWSGHFGCDTRRVRRRHCPGSTRQPEITLPPRDQQDGEDDGPYQRRKLARPA